MGEKQPLSIILSYFLTKHCVVCILRCLLFYVCESMSKEMFVRKALMKLKDVWNGASGLLYMLDMQRLDPSTIDALCVLIQEAMSPVYNHNKTTQEELGQTLQKLEQLKIMMKEEQERESEYMDLHEDDDRFL